MTIDYTQPLALLLRDCTREVHDVVANSRGAKLLLSGNLAKEEYIRYLMMLWHIYSALERALDRHAAHPALEPTYNPTLLARAPALEADIAHLLQVQESTWKVHRLHINLLKSMPPQLNIYISRINELSDSEDPSALLAHSYVRYLGDLSGGQTIRHTLAKAYDLDESSGQGISFYAFKELRSAKSASQGEMKRIKEWFRDGINSAGEINIGVKEATLGETALAFNYNASLFECIALKERKSGETSELLAVTDKQTVPEQKVYTVSQVMAFIAAMCLAHFVIVTGGFTGSQGYEKLLVIAQWMNLFWSSLNVDGIMTGV